MKSVLLVEDNPAERELVDLILKGASPADYSVTHCGRLSRAIELLIDNRFDVVLLDLSLPDSRGVDTCRSVCDRFPTTAVVVMTGLDDEGLAVQALQVGAQDFVFKSKLEPMVLTRTLGYAIERKRFEMELIEAQHQIDAQKHQAEITHLARINLMGEMASGMAHELNQPLTALVGFAHSAQALLEPDTLDRGKLTDVMEQIVRESHRAAEIIRGLRHLVRRRDRVRADHDLNEVIENVCRIIGFASRDEAELIELELDDPPPVVSIDRVQIEQVLINLVRNAIEATPDCVTGKAVQIYTSADAERVKVSVRDQGARLDDATVARFFEPYFSTKTNGLGMGLPLSRSIIEEHEGALNAKPCDDRGLEVTFDLPLRRND